MVLKWATSFCVSSLAIPLSIARVIVSAVYPANKSTPILPLTQSNASTIIQMKGCDDKTTVFTIKNNRATLATCSDILADSVSMCKMSNENERQDNTSDTMGCMDIRVNNTQFNKIGNFIELTHGKTHYCLEGPDNGPLVTLLHGVSVFSFIWCNFVNMLVKHGYRVLTFDFYGHGYSAVPNVTYNVDLFVGQVEDLLTKLGLMAKYRALFLVGHSMGGLVATEFTARNIDLVRKLVLFNSAGLPVQINLQNTLPYLLTPLIKLIRSTSVLDTIAHQLGKGLSVIAKRNQCTYQEICLAAHHLSEEIEAETTLFAKLLLEGSARLLKADSGFRFARALKFLVSCWLHQINVNAERVQVLLSIVRELPLLDANHAETLQRIQEDTSVLIIWGEEDGILPLSLLQDFKTHLPHAELLSVPKSDHAVFLQKPKLVFDTMLRFFSQSVALSV